MVLLNEFDFLTKTVCAGTSYGTINLTIVTYNALMEKIEQFRDNAFNKANLPNLCRRAETGYRKLQKYYGAIDNSPVYAVVTALHPAMRFQYWANKGWDKAFQIEAIQVVRGIWRKHY